MPRKEFPVFNIGTDIDGVVLQSDIPLLKRVKQITGITIERSDLQSWKSVETIVYRKTSDLSLAREMNNLWFDPESLRNSPPYKGAIITAILCRGLPHSQQYAITSRPPEFRDSTIQNLLQHLPFIDWNTHLLIRNNLSQNGDDFKVDQIKSRGIAHMTEDSPTTFHELVTRTTCGLTYINQPWNSSDDRYQNYRANPNNFARQFCDILRARQRFYLYQ